MTFRLLLLFSVNSFFVHFAWEMLQIPLYQEMTELPHGAGVWTCTKATIGDVAIAVAAYLAAAWTGRTFFWFCRPPVWPTAVYFATGLSITVVFEFFATVVLQRWDYSDLMPTLPLLNTGMSPLLQWVIVPAVVLAGTRLMFLGLDTSKPPL